MDNASDIILGVEATQARFRQETLAARRMLARVKERFGICAEGVGMNSYEKLSGPLTRLRHLPQASRTLK